MGPRIEFVVVLPYSLEGFTAALQDKFKEGIAATASAGCACEIIKTEVTITVKETAAAPGTRRRLLAASSITVDVSILVPDVEKGNLLVSGTALSKEAINDELEKLGVESITGVTSSPVLYQGASAANQTDGGPQSLEDKVDLGGIIGGTLGGLVVLVMIAVYVFWRYIRPGGKVAGG